MYNLLCVWFDLFSSSLDATYVLKQHMDQKLQNNNKNKQKYDHKHDCIKILYMVIYCCILACMYIVKTPHINNATICTIISKMLSCSVLSMCIYTLEI